MKLMLRSHKLNWYSIRFQIPIENIENGKRNVKKMNTKTIGNERYMVWNVVRPPFAEHISTIIE